MTHAGRLSNGSKKAKSETGCLFEMPRGLGLVLAGYMLAVTALVLSPATRASDASANEGQTVYFTVSIPLEEALDGYYGNPLRYSYTTVDNTAVAGTDYKKVSGRLEFSHVDATAQLSVPTYRDNTNHKRTQTFYVKFNNPQVKMGISGWQSAPSTYLSQGLPSQFRLTGTIVRW